MTGNPIRTPPKPTVRPDEIEEDVLAMDATQRRQFCARLRSLDVGACSASKSASLNACIRSADQRSFACNAGKRDLPSLAL
jgi:hypothetical protein